MFYFKNNSPCMYHIVIVNVLCFDWFYFVWTNWSPTVSFTGFDLLSCMFIGPFSTVPFVKTKIMRLSICCHGNQIYLTGLACDNFESCF